MNYKQIRTDIPGYLGLDETWTQETLANIVGVSPNYWARVERGEKSPSDVFIHSVQFALALARTGNDPRRFIQ